MAPWIAFGIVAAGLAPPAAAATLVIEDFEDVSDWNGLAPEAALVKEGAGAGRWADTVARTSIRRVFDPPLDLSGHDHIGLWVWSAVANGAELQLVFDSENDASSGSDYYSTALRIDWQGWRYLWIPREALTPSREPLGWDRIGEISLSASGWGHTPLPDTDLVLDHLVAADAVVVDVTRRQGWQGGDFVYTFAVTLEEPDGQPLGVDLQVDADAALEIDVQPAHVDLTADGSAVVTVTVTLPPAVIDDGPYLTFDVAFAALTAGGGREAWIEPVATPPEERAPPRMLLTAEDVARVSDWAARLAWAEDRRQGILDRADAFPAGFLAEYGLPAVALPPEGGQWGMHYVCPVHGANLQYSPPMTHRCPVDNATYAGWPYDQVIYARQHGDLAEAARTLGLAWQLTGDAGYAEAAADLLLAYAAAYEGYPIHDIDGGASGSGARVLAQTLDESAWLVNVAWAYDLVADGGALSAAERDRVEQRLLRPAASVIARNDAGGSNWQAWHNAAIAAAGRALDDPRLVAQALHGPSGFHFHMAESVLADGFWYEGSWGYHFFTLTPMTYLAEMGARGGFPLYDDPALRSMYEAPVRFAPPDLVLPAFNDSGTVDLRGSAGWRLEAAYRAYGEPLLLVPLVGEARPTEALFWGAETLPTEAPEVTGSEIFAESGYAILRGGTAEDPWWAALDFGPHGGWHGHYDKLGLVLFGRGRMLGLDPGSHSYALPLHDTWDRSTVAHDTVVVDEAVQSEATGALERFFALPGLAWARASGGEASSGNALARDVVLAEGYVVDRFTVEATDGQAHRYDWLWHATGALETDLGLAPYADLPASAGYQHLAEAVAAEADGPSRFTFRWDGETTYPGSVWSNDPAVVATQDYDDTQAAEGRSSVRLGYDFTAAAADAYVTYRTRSMAAIRDEVPTAISVQVRGDGSGHTFRLRIVDATGESHVSEAAPLDFTGWREIALPVAGFGHWSGNDDGVIDLPLGSLVLELDREPGGPAQGSLWLDAWRLTFPAAGQVLVEGYERLGARTTVRFAGEAGTTYVTGTGIGPDLGEPVPFVMARRQGAGASFDVLHEPHGEAGPRVATFERLATGADPEDAAAGYRVTGAGFEDHLLLVSAGAAGETRVFGAFSTDGLLAHVRATEGATAITGLTLIEGSLVDSGERPLFVAEARLDRASFAIATPEVEIREVQGELAGARLFAPGTTRVTWQGQDVEFHLEGDYVVFARLPGTDPGGGAKGCGCQAPAGSGPGAGFPLLLALLAALALIGRGRRRRPPHRRRAPRGRPPRRQP